MSRKYTVAKTSMQIPTHLVLAVKALLAEHGHPVKERKEKEYDSEADYFRRLSDHLERERY
jgi:hypothetical protein